MPHDDKPLCKVMNYHQLIECLKFPNHCELVKLQHILADEVHNYKENPETLQLSEPWWRSITRIEDCTYWFFLDKSQKITTESTVIIPSDVVSRHLTTVIRTTGNIFNFYKRYIATDTSNVKLGHNIQGSFPEILIPKFQSHQEKEKMLQNILLSTLHKLIFYKGFSRNNITVLFTDTKDMERYRKVFLIRAKNCPIRNGEQRNEDGVIFDTIRRYSGDEKSIVIGFCPRFYHSSRFQDNMALMASLCSRPQLELILVFDSKETALSFQVKNGEWKWYSPPTNQIYDFSS